MNFFGDEEEEQDELAPYKQQVWEQIKQKYSPEKRQALVDENAAAASGPQWAAGLAAFGAGLQGKDASEAGRKFKEQQAGERQGKLDAFDKNRELALTEDKRQRETDPNSMESQLARNLAVQMDPGGKYDGLTAEQFKAFSPVMQKKYELAEREKDRAESRAERYALLKDKQLDRASQQDIARSNKLFDLEEKRAYEEAQKKLVADEKKKAAVTEVEDRRRNIEDNLTALENMIKEKGTYEAFGSHNIDIDRKVEQIATDMAKLSDPSSVARPSEVEGFKKGLIKASATDMTNDTALNVLNNFRNEVNNRVSNAYAIRGVENPGSQKQLADKNILDKRTPAAQARVGDTKIINGIPHEKHADGLWYPVNSATAGN